MNNQTTQFLAGFAEVDITPSRGVQIAGDIGKHRGVETVHDPLFARALILQSPSGKIGLVSLDLCFAKEPYITAIRQSVHSILNIEPHALLIHATHTHGAPGLGSLVVDHDSPYITPDIRWLADDPAYGNFVVSKVVEALSQADRNLQPATLGFGRCLESRIAFNRRFVMRDGTSCCHPQEPDKILHSEGPIDPEVGVVAIRSHAGQLLGMLLNYSCHPVHGYAEHYVTAGWPGAWVHQLKSKFGSSCVPMVFNGFSGNVHHHNHLDETHDESYERMGLLLADDTAGIIERMTYSDSIELNSQIRRIAASLRRMNAEELTQTKRFLCDHPTPMWKPNEKENIDWNWVYAVSRLNVHEQAERNPSLECEVQVFQMGPFALVAFPGEPFVEAALRIKLASPYQQTLAMGHCNSYVGYLPTERAHKGGGYETRLCNWSKLSVDALDRLTDAAMEMLTTMKTGR